VASVGEIIAALERVLVEANAATRSVEQARDEITDALSTFGQVLAGTQQQDIQDVVIVLTELVERRFPAMINELTTAATLVRGRDRTVEGQRWWSGWRTTTKFVVEGQLCAVWQ